MREIEKAREFFGCDADEHSDECASVVDYAEDETGCGLLSALLLSERDAARREAVEECAKILDGREWSARQGAKDALTDGSRFFQCGEEKAYRDGANHLRTLLPPAPGTKEVGSG